MIGVGRLLLRTRLIVIADYYDVLICIAILMVIARRVCPFSILIASVVRVPIVLRI
ncbi:MAG: hypothetical protein ACLQDV_22445 [Candidatus Binataceae bacterium]